MTTPVSALSFHCMICFEEFHHADRYPVVLPCGHTYVCNVCAERLDKCMECRTLLTWSIPVPSASRPNVATAKIRTGWSTSGRTGGRGRTVQGRGEGGRGEVPPMEKKRLPLPKNVVLLSLMEATELASEMEQTRTRIDSLLEEDIEDENDIFDEEEKIKVSTSLTIGACGTYIVSEKMGLEVYPSRPNASSELDSSNNEDKDMPGEEDVNALVRFFHLDHKLELRVTEGEGNLKTVSSEESALLQLHYGDRVQIVSFDDDDGWAKLARGYGYIRANPRQLVKVGGSVDRACRIEAYLHALAARKRELKAEASKIDTRFTGLMNNLQESLFTDEDLTVIAADTFENDGGAIVIPQDEDQRSDIGHTFSDDSDLRKPSALVRQSTPPMDSGLSACSMGSVFQWTATLGGDDDPVPPLASIAPASSADCLGLGPVLQAEHLQEQAIEPARVHPQARRSPPRTRELSAEAEAWRERYYQNPQRSRGVDFRTGLSGHQGLANYMVHPHAYLDHHTRTIPKMSNHSGLSRAARASKSSGVFPSPSHSYSRDSP